MKIQEKIKKWIEETLEIKEGFVLAHPKDIKNGDYSFFSHSPDKANDFKQKLDENKISEVVKVETAGPFVNFYLSKEFFASSIEEINKQKDKFGSLPLKNKTWVIEHTSPNPNKAMHIGHLRNNLTGMALTRIAEANGYKIICDAIDNNRGIAITKLMWGYLKFGKKNKEYKTDLKYWHEHQDEWQNPNESNLRPDRFVDDLYVKGSSDFESDPEIEEIVRSFVVEWENENKIIWELWKKVLGYSYKGQEMTLKRLDNRWDFVWHEHEHYKIGKEFVMEGLKKDIQKLEIEKEALKSNKTRQRVIARQLADLKEKASGIEAKWQSERETIAKIRNIKEKIEKAKFEVEIAQNSGELQKVAELKYGEVPTLLKELNAVEKKLVRFQKNRPILKEEVSKEEVANVVSRWTGIPVTRLLEEEAKKLENMEDVLAKRVVGQKEAIVAISNAIRRARAGISEENRPLGSFMFLGPTGVGKTETAKALAGFLFNDENSLVRLDMSEYMEKHTISKMIGSPPGYVGYEEGGQLTDKIRRRPYSVILLDEIEKAHPDVFNILLQILEDGRLTDAKGRVASFKNVILIMTSNLGSEHIAKMSSLGFVGNEEGEKNNLKDKVMESLKNQFRPEFLNRIDEIIIFDYLKKVEIRKIVDLELKKVAERLIGKGINISILDEVKEYLVERGFDPNLGARPLKRVIQKLVLDPLAVQIVTGKVSEGGNVLVGIADERIVFNNQKLPFRHKKEKSLV